MRAVARMRRRSIAPDEWYLDPTSRTTTPPPPRRVTTPSTSRIFPLPAALPSRVSAGFPQLAWYFPSGAQYPSFLGVRLWRGFKTCGLCARLVSSGASRGSQWPTDTRFKRWRSWIRLPALIFGRNSQPAEPWLCPPVVPVVPRRIEDRWSS